MVAPPTLSIFPGLSNPKKLFRESVQLADDDWKVKQGFAEFTGIGHGIGLSTVYNSRLAALQFEFTLLAAGHEYAQQLVESQDPRAAAAQLVDKKILQGARIVDFGCGYSPTYARCARALGAQVYTVDVIPAAKFEVFGEPAANEHTLRACDEQYHIQKNIDSPDALEWILERTGGPVHIVTQAHLFTDYHFTNSPHRRGEEGLEKMFLDLLLPHGCYVGMNGWRNRILMKEEPETNYADPFLA